MTIRWKAAWLVPCAAFLNFGAALAQSLPGATPQSVGMSASRLDNLTHVIQSAVDAGNLPGAVIMINRRGKLVYSRAIGYQNRDAGIPMKLDSIFRIYSMSKPIAAVAAMMLEENGRIVLTDPVGKYLPEFLDMQVCNPGRSVDNRATCSLVPAERPIMVLDLLRHTSGIAYGEVTKNDAVREEYRKAGLYAEGGLPFDDLRQLSPSDERRLLAKAPLVAQPGANWEYGMSMDLMGRVIDVAAGESLGHFLQERILQPLHMKDTGFYVPAEKQARLAEPLTIDPVTKQSAGLFDVSRPPMNESAGAGMVSTAADYMNFASMLLNGGVLEGVRILSPMTIALMASDQLGTRTAISRTPGELVLGSEGYTFGLGFGVRQATGLASVQGSAGEYMWAGAAGTFFWVDPKEQLAVVVMSQVTRQRGPYLRTLVKELVSAAVAAP